MKRTSRTVKIPTAVALAKAHKDPEKILSINPCTGHRVLFYRDPPSPKSFTSSSNLGWTCKEAYERY
jgi:hypothetical protein